MDNLTVTTVEATLEARIAELEAELDKTVRLSAAQAERDARRLEASKKVINKQAEQLKARPVPMATVKAVTGVAETLFDAISAETARRNHNVTRNPDGSWPALQPDSQDKRYPYTTGAIIADSIATACNRALAGYTSAAGKKYEGLASTVTELTTQIEDMVSKIERRGGIEEASAQTLDSLENALNKRDSLLDVEKALRNLLTAAVGAYLDANAGTIAQWVPFDHRANKEAPAQKAGPVDRAALAARIRTQRTA